jgi:hypothetical protein
VVTGVAAHAADYKARHAADAAASAERLFFI